MDRKKPQAFEVYRHFEGGLYQIITLAVDDESGREMVVYQALNGNNQFYTSPLTLFQSKIESDNSQDTLVKYRFEPCGNENHLTKRVNISVQNQSISQKESKDIQEKEVERDKADLLSGVHPAFLQLLDAKTYLEKMILLRGMKDQLDDKMITNIAMALDFSVEEGTLEERYESLLHGLQILEKYECTRLR